MPRYIDGDKLCEYYQERHKNLCLKYGETDAYCQGYEDAMYVAEHHDFTADVVPKSEVVKIFDEIEKKLSSMKYNANTSRKTVKVEELKEQVDWVLHKVVPNAIAELKKKYTEGNDG